jgi:hypothetical protein
MDRRLKGIAALAILILALLILATPAHAQNNPAASPPGEHPQQDQRIDPEPFVVGWGTLTLINAGIAQGKNRKGLNWFLISIFLGPIATFLLVAFFPKLPDPNLTTPAG